MGRRPNPTPEELTQEAADDAELSGLIQTGVVSVVEKPFTFCNDEQKAAWRQALAQLANKDNPSVEGLLRFLEQDRPIDPRLVRWAARLTRLGGVIPINGPQPEDIDLLPERLGEVVVPPCGKPRFRERSPGRRSIPGSRRKAEAAAAEVARRKNKEPDTAVTLLIAEVAGECGVSPSRVGEAYEILGYSRGQKNSK